MEDRLLLDSFTEESTHWWHRAKRILIKGFIGRKHSKILVAGIGGGLLCEELKQAGHDVTGLDISQVACEYVSKKTGIPVIRADLEVPLPLAENYFDFIILADVLEHLERDKQLLRKVFLSLKPKGAVIITVPAYQHMFSLWDRRLGHKRRYSLSAIKKEVIDSGLSIQKASYYHTLLYPCVYLYRKLFRLPKQGKKGGSDFSVFSGRPAAFLFAAYYHLERLLLKIADLPFGLSILVVGVKCP